MSDNQTIETKFIAEADLTKARAELDAFFKAWNGKLEGILTGLTTAEQKTLKTLQTFNKAVGQVEQLNRRIERDQAKATYGPRDKRLFDASQTRKDIKAEAASIESELYQYRKRVTRAIAGTVLEIDAEIKKLEKRLGELGKSRVKNAEEIARIEADLGRLRGARSTMAGNAFVGAELSEARTTARRKALRDLASEERFLQKASEDLAAAKLRLAQIDIQLQNLTSQGTLKSKRRVSELQEEKTALVQLSNALEAVQGVQARMTARETKVLSRTLTKDARETVTQARAYIASEQRIAEIKERISQHEQGQIRLSNMQLEQLRLELSLNQRNLELLGQEERVLERVARLRERGNNRAQPTRDPVETAARRYLDLEKQIAANEAAITRHKQANTAEDQKQIALLDQELQRLRAQLIELSKIEGVEARITTLRAQRHRDPRPVKEPVQDVAIGPQRTLRNFRADGGVGILGIQAELMANYAVLSGIQTAISGGFRYMAQHETALAQFRAIASASATETQRIDETIRKLGESTKYTNVQLADTATLLAQAGLSAADTSPALENISKLATAAGIELRQAADVVTSVANVWQYQASQMGDIANVLTAALNQTKLGMDQMQLGIQYAANTAQDANIGFVELTSALGAMAQAGIRSGSTMGTGMRTLIVNLEDPTKKTKEALERFGLTLADVDVRTLGLTQVLKNLKAAGFDTAAAYQAFEIRAAAAFAALSSNVDVMEDLQVSLYDNMAASTANSVQMDTQTAKWTQLKNVMQATASDALSPVLGFLKLTTDAARGLFSIIDGGNPVVQGLTAGFTALLAVMVVQRIWAATIAIGGMTTATTAATVATTAATAATVGWTAALMANPIGLIAAGLVGLTVAIMSATGAFEKQENVLDRIKAQINNTQSRLQELRTSIQAVDKTIHSLTMRFGLFENQETMKGNLLREAKAKFRDLGLQIDDTSDNVYDMIEALKLLRAELEREFSNQLFELAAQMRREIRQMKNDLAQGSTLSRDERIAFLRDNYGRSFVVTGDQTYAHSDVLAGHSAAEQFATRVVLGQESLRDPNTLRQIVDEGTITSTQRALRDQIKALQDLEVTGDVKGDALKRLKADLKRMTALQGLFDRVVQQNRSILQREADEIDTQKRAEYEGWRNTSGSRQSELVMNLDDLFRDSYAAANRVRSQQGLTDTQRHAQGQQILAEAREKARKKKDELRAAYGSLDPRHRDEYLREQFERIDSSYGRLQNIFSPYNARDPSAERAAAASRNVDRDVAKALVEALEKRMDNIRRRLPTMSQDERDAASIEYGALMDQLRPLKEDQVRKSIASKRYSTPGDPRNAIIERAEMEAFEYEMEERQLKFEEDFAKANFKAVKGLLEAQMKANLARVEELIDSMDFLGEDQLGEALGEATMRNQQNISIAERLFRAENANRLSNPSLAPEAFEELTAILTKELIAAAERASKIVDAYVAAQSVDEELQVRDTQTLVRRGQKRNENTWRLERRLEAEQYALALERVRAAEEGLLDVELRRGASLANLMALKQQIAEVDEKLKDSTLSASDRAKLEASLLELRAQIVAAEALLASLNNEVRRRTRDVRARKSEAEEAEPPRTYRSTNMTGWRGTVGGFLQQYEQGLEKAGSLAEQMSQGIYRTFDATRTGLADVIKDIVSGAKDGEEAWRAFGVSILQTMADTAAQMMANAMIQWMLKMFSSWVTGTPTSSGPTAASPTSAKHGGLIKARRFALGGGTPNRDSVLALLEPGEVVMRKSAVDFVGRDNLERINARGNTRVSELGSRVATATKREPDKVNVWVVSPNQVPPPGPKDIVHIVGQEMAHGSLKKLVRQVAVGG